MTFTTKPDYWSILGVSPGSDLPTIKRAFRTEARRWHPDLNVNDVNAEERFKLVNEAYAVLSDPQKRSIWEASLDSYTPPEDLFKNEFPTYDEYINIVLGIKNDDEVDIYKDEQSNNIDLNIEDESDTESINYDYKESSNSYNNKYAPTTSNQPPPPVKKTTELESLIELSPEEALYGTSIQIELPDNSWVEVETPPFAGDGWRLRLSGVVIGGEDHFLQLRVKTDEDLRIDGLRVLYRLELFPSDALFGCAVDIPTLDGPVTLQVPPNSSSGRLLRLRGRGLQYDDLTGDQIVEIVVVIPADLSEAEIALYRRLQELSVEPYRS